MKSIRAYVEGETDIPVLNRLAEAAGLRLHRVVATGGVGALDRLLPGLRAAASPAYPILVLRDVDPTPPNLKGTRFARCASRVLANLKTANRAPGFCLRLARHEMEAWLLADRRAFALWLGCSPNVVPPKPDELLKPSLEIVRLAAKSGTKPKLAAMLVPADGSITQFGPGFEAAITSFARGAWNPERASGNSRSLKRSLRALRLFASRP